MIGPPWRRFDPGPPSRVALRPATPADAGSLADWLPLAWLDMSAGAYDPATVPTAEQWLGSDSGLPLLIEVARLPVGFARCRPEPGLLVIEEIAVARSHRHLGYGGEAVQAIEAALGHPVRAEALVPLANGLAIYFWLRAGYRPCFTADSGRRGITVMARLSAVPGPRPAV